MAEADQQDRAEIAVWAHVDEKRRGELCRNRAAFDASLSAPSGRMAAAEKALLRELGGRS